MSDFRKGMCKKWAWQGKPGVPALGRWRQENGGSRLSSTDKNRPTAEPLLFFLSIYFGFFKAIIKKKKNPVQSIQKKVAILEKSLKENIPLELNFQNFC